MHIVLNAGMSADTAKLKVEHKSQLTAEGCDPDAALTVYHSLPFWEQMRTDNNSPWCKCKLKGGLWTKKKDMKTYLPNHSKQAQTHCAVWCLNKLRVLGGTVMVQQMLKREYFKFQGTLRLQLHRALLHPLHFEQVLYHSMPRFWFSSGSGFFLVPTGPYPFHQWVTCLLEISSLSLWLLFERFLPPAPAFRKVVQFGEQNRKLLF